MFYIGIDVGKNNHEIAITDDKGNKLSKSLSFKNTSDGFEKMLAFIKSFDVSVSNSLWGLEATGHYWIAIYSHINELGFNINLINPIQTDSFRNMNIRKVKNDRIDAFLIADVIRFGNFNNAPIADETIASLKHATRYRVYLVDNVSAIKVKVITLLDQVFPEYEKLFSDVFGVASKTILATCQSPEDFLNISTTKLTNILKKASRGRFDKEKAIAIKEAAKSSFGLKFSQDILCFEMKQLLSQMEYIENQIAELDKQISELFNKTNYTNIKSITGIGDVTGAMIIAEIGDISKFSEPKKLIAFAGLDASVKQSGEYMSTSNHMSKRGSPYLRRALWNSSLIAAFKDPMFSKYYENLRSRGKPHLVAIGAVARKMCNIIFAVLTKNITYDPYFTQ